MAEVLPSQTQTRSGTQGAGKLSTSQGIPIREPEDLHLASHVERRCEGRGQSKMGISGKARADSLQKRCTNLVTCRRISAQHTVKEVHTAESGLRQ